MVLLDVFRGQCTEEILDKNNTLYILLPANCTDRLQPIHLSVNKPAKDYMKAKFQDWYGSIVYKQLEDGVEESVDLRLSTTGPKHKFPVWKKCI